MNVEETLRSVSLFKSLSSKHLKQIAKFATPRSFDAGHQIVGQGDTGYGLYNIQTGRVNVTRETDGGSRQVRTMGPGESFGEIALLDDQPRSATVTAIEPTTVLLLDKWQFRGELNSHPEIALALLPVLVGYLRDRE